MATLTPQAFAKRWGESTLSERSSDQQHFLDLCEMLGAPGNPNGKPNSDVVRLRVNGLDITRRPRDMWIIDFGTGMSLEDSALYEAPFEYQRIDNPTCGDEKQLTCSRPEFETIHLIDRVLTGSANDFPGC